MSGKLIVQDASLIIGKSPNEVIRIAGLFKNYFQGKPASDRAYITEKNFDALVSYFEGAEGLEVLEKYFKVPKCGNLLRSSR